MFELLEAREEGAVGVRRRLPGGEGVRERRGPTLRGQDAPDLDDLLSPAGNAQMEEVSLELLGQHIAEGNENVVDAVERDPRHFSPMNKL